jgi:hypothetical protein
VEGEGSGEKGRRGGELGKGSGGIGVGEGAATGRIEIDPYGPYLLAWAPPARPNQLARFVASSARLLGASF